MNNIKDILHLHELWLNHDPKGMKADLAEADIQCADLRQANLRGVNFRKANLLRTELQGADLREVNFQKAILIEVDFRGADLRGADLRRANLQEANFRGADLRHADFREADIRRATFDYSAWPLWCGSFNCIVDDCLVWQLMAHITRLDVSHCTTSAKTAVEALSDYANMFCDFRRSVLPID